ncbi:sterol desaturase family protein [Novosphingobium clariflavum]|uniref:Sterol desaturase family protein n=1 Tax=Novosphingobium clariflavum TaxID=2029884 RepID=A0ABV6S6B1_9SPHN|nr:sterol desaturase family protein [Novosphingobium clariflavum]
MHEILAVLRPLFFAALLLVPLEWLLPARGPDRRTRAGIVADILHATVGTLMIRFGAMLLLALIAPFDPLVHLSGTIPVWLQAIILLLVCDFIIWCVHRSFHASPFLWRFHRIHHSSPHLDWLATARVHPVEQIVFATAMALPMCIAAFSPAAVAIYMGFYTLHANLLHADTRLSFGPLDAVFTPPRVHHWHHADEVHAYDSNFGSQLVIWDKLFGTAYRPEAERPSRFGVEQAPPENFVDHLAAPFRAQPELRSDSGGAVAESAH